MRLRFTRRQLLAAAGTACLPSKGSARERFERSFWVLKLLRPACLNVRALGTARLHCSSGERSWIVEGSETLALTADSARVRITGPAGVPVGCVLEIPNAIQRSYFGRFDVFSDGVTIVPVLSMDCECATGSILGAELPVDACSLSALAAQAVVSRSILCAATRARHRFADFCDTTHCQFLRSPAVQASKAWQGAEETRGLVLFQREEIFPALYSAACGGATESGVDNQFEYVSVPCEVCRSHGTARRGHGFGLCQEGAMELGRRGWTWREILNKYYPNSAVGYKN